MAKSSGKTGERIAEIWFREHGWKMFRHQPETKTVYLKGKGLTTIQCRSDGVADYTGYEIIKFLNSVLPMYRACEVKEAFGDTMPCSRLGKAQRDWMAAIDFRSAFVGVLWMDVMVFEIFRFHPKGSYQRGQGLEKTAYR